MAENYAQEYIQEIVPDVGVNIAASASGQEAPHSTREMLRSANEAGVAGAMVAAILGTAGKVVSAGADITINSAYESISEKALKNTLNMDSKQANEVITALVNSKEFDKEGQLYIEALDNHQSIEDNTGTAEQGANVNLTDEGIKRAEKANVSGIVTTIKKP